MTKNWCILPGVWFFITLVAFCSLGPINGFTGSVSRDLKQVERSFSVDACLTTLGRQGHSATNLPSAFMPTETEIQRAAHLLTGDYAANRLYLIYRKDMAIVDAERVFETWRRSCPPEVDVVPALMLHPWNSQQDELFSSAEMKLLTRFFKGGINPTRLAVIGLKGESDEGASFKLLASEFKSGLLCIGLQPAAKVGAPFSGAVLELKNALCPGKSNEDWQQSGSGLATLRKYAVGRNEQSLPVTWNLLVTAGDYNGSGSAADDDPERNMPLPSWRNTLAAREILDVAQPSSFSGFNTDLHSLQVSSQTLTHDGSGYSFYEMLKRGQIYVGFYARPFHEIVKVYTSIRTGHAPEVPR